jgi:hypothetical protein
MTLNFANECAAEYDIPGVAETVYFREEILDLVFGARQKADKLTVLTIKNMQDYQDTGVLEGDNFMAVRGRLTELHLHIVTEHDHADDGNTVNLEARHTCFNDDIPKYWLKPTTNKLTHLTLYADVDWGYGRSWTFAKSRHFRNSNTSV